MKWGYWVFCLYYLLKLSLKNQEIDLGGWGAKLNNLLLILKNKNIYTLDFKRIE